MNKHERHDHIVEHAKNLFVRKGYPNTTVTDIIEKARIARSTFYNHFSHKLDIFKILMDQYAGILLDAILSINLSRTTPGLSLTGQIREMSLPLITAIKANQDLTQLLITASLGHDDRFDRCISDFFAQIQGAIKQLLNEGMEGGTIRSLDPETISYVILGSIKQLLLQWVVYRDISSIEDSLDDIIDYILFGIARQGTGRSPI